MPCAASRRPGTPSRPRSPPPTPPVAIGLRDGPAAGLDALGPVLADRALATYGYLSAARADFLRQLGRWQEAAVAYEEALALTGNEAERDFLARRLTEVRSHLA
jgi:RNA polymerase sigma-70 factor (ECF subfamily)